jgi:3-hydroxyisobutyrate dehydrogenase
MKPIISPASTIVGWIGTGVMGASMCGHLLAAGYRVVVHTRTVEKARPLVQKGAVWTDTVAATAAAADVVCTMVGLPSDVEQIYFDPEGILEHARPGSLLIDFTTSSPQLAARIAAEAAARTLDALDGPVSGGDLGAREARLSVMLGGDAAAVERATPLLSVFCKTIAHLGGPGFGQHTKVVNQVLIASTMIGVCEGLLYGFAAGLPIEEVIRVVGAGAARCFSLDSYAPRIVKGDYAPGFFVEHFVKDLDIALTEAERLGLTLPGAELARRLYQKLVATGRGRSGSQALIIALAELSGQAFGLPAGPRPDERRDEDRDG